MITQNSITPSLPYIYIYMIYVYVYVYTYKVGPLVISYTML